MLQAIYRIEEIFGGMSPFYGAFNLFATMKIQEIGSVHHEDWFQCGTTASPFPTHLHLVDALVDTDT